MNRRFFLQALGLGLVSATVDVDRLLWVPGERTYFLPEPGITYLTLEDIAREAVRIFTNNLQSMTFAYKSYDSRWLAGHPGFAQHPTLSIHVPRRFAQ